MASRVKLVAKSRKANKILTYDMKRDPYAYVTDRKDKWNIFHLIVGCNSGFTLKMTLTGRLNDEQRSLACIMEATKESQWIYINTISCCLRH